MTTDPAGLRILDDEACWRHLTSHRPRVGRLAFHEGGRLHLLPVAYALDAKTIVVRTDPSRPLGRIAEEDMVAFEVDAVDEHWEQGWSVLIQGRAAVVTDEAELAEVQRLPLHPWARGDRSRYLRITPTHVSGRRIL